MELGGSRIENKGRLVGRGAEASSPPSPVVKSHTCAVLYAVMNLYASSRTCQGLPSEWLACSACVWSALLCACPLVTSFGITVRVSICVCSTCNESFKQRGREGRRSGSVGQQWSRLRLGTHLGWPLLPVCSAPWILLHFETRIFNTVWDLSWQGWLPFHSGWIFFLK